MRTPSAMIMVLLVTLASGCTHRQLTKSTVRTASTIMEIEYRMVLDNLAMFTCRPDSLPWHIKLKDGTVQISDEGTFSADAFTTFGGNRPGLDTFGPEFSRDVSEQWGADAVTDPLEVKTLQDVYRQAIGLPPEPDPSFITQAKRHQAREASSSNGSDDSESDSEEDSPDSSDGGAGYEVPIGWFHVGCEEDVPKNACYVGNFEDRYVWVMPEGIQGLSRFTLIILSIVKLEPGEGGPSSGLAVTN